MYINPRETLDRLKRTAIHAPTAEERQLAFILYTAQLEKHNRPTVKDMAPVVVSWP